MEYPPPYPPQPKKLSKLEASLRWEAKELKKRALGFIKYEIPIEIAYRKRQIKEQIGRLLEWGKSKI